METKGKGLPEKPLLQLFVVGEEANSRRARINLQAITERLSFPCEVEVVDVLRDYRRALASNILVAPMLLISSGSKCATVAGDLSDLEKVIGIMNATAMPP